MKIIRWLLSHTFLILLIVAVIYGYMFWGNLAGENTPVGKAIAYLSSEFVEVEDFIAAVKVKQSQLSEKDSAGLDTAASQSDASGETVNEMAAAGGKQADDKQASVPAEEGRSIDQQPVNISYSHNNRQINQNSDTAAEAKQLAMSAGNTPASTGSGNTAPGKQATGSRSGGAFVSAEVENQLNNVDDQGRVMDKSQSVDVVRQSWIAARKSFYQRDYQQSEKSYQEVIDNTTDNFDAYGELGNVYFNQGKNKQAANAYFEAAAILIRKGQVNRARSLMGLLRHLDNAKAEELKKLIDSSMS